jgi:predicted nucleic acid-binding Zn ribbon protein
MVPAQRVLPGLIASVIRPAPLCDEKVTFAWRTSVGAAMARATRVRLRPEGLLQVTADTPAWTREVERSIGLIRSRLEAFLGPDVIQRVEIHHHD